MTTVIIDNNSRTGSRLLKQIEKHPRVAQVMDDVDNTPLPVPEEELIPLETFKERIFERLGLKMSL
jgi:hypothetical protein